MKLIKQVFGDNHFVKIFYNVFVAHCTSPSSNSNFPLLYSIQSPLLNVNKSSFFSLPPGLGALSFVHQKNTRIPLPLEYTGFFLKNHYNHLFFLPIRSVVLDILSDLVVLPVFATSYTAVTAENPSKNNIAPVIL